MCTGRMAVLCNMALCIIRLYVLITAASISQPKLEDWKFGNMLPDHRISHAGMPQAGNKLQGHRISQSRITKSGNKLADHRKSQVRIPKAEFSSPQNFQYSEWYCLFLKLCI